ncbi:MAG: ACP S-malonyltransferase [Anaerolineae bacterium]|jgi:[acyl-carrier-protein] S-malonyltransferase|nr:ACP S-malonyltransferase [Anaerolineae bacterium]
MTINGSNIALIFPGQGSQEVGMGQDIAAAYPVAREVFEQATALLGEDLSVLPEEALNQTYNTQPALYVCSIAILRALQSELGPLYPAAVAGHSLGEFTALTAAGSLSFEDGLRLVRERARLMRDAGDDTPGAMAALLGLEVDAAQAVCLAAQAQTGGVLVVANDNCPGQLVISGDLTTLEIGLELAKAAGAKRAVKLAVSIAAHSPLMDSASEALYRQIAETEFKPPLIPVYANVTATRLDTVDAIRSELHHQLTRSVRWTDSIRAMIHAGAETFIEIGSKEVLTGLLKRIDRNAKGLAINNLPSLQTWIESMQRNVPL